jgi:uncharacterized protein (TIGR00251 family)
MLPWRVVGGSIELAVRVTPRAAKTVLAGVTTDAQGRPTLQIRLAAPPVEGAANDALVAFLASELGLGRRDVAIRNGQGSRAKQVRLDGDPDDLVLRLARWIPPQSTSADHA